MKEEKWKKKRKVERENVYATKKQAKTTEKRKKINKYGN